MRAQLLTAGERMTVESDLGWVDELLAEGAAGRLTAALAPPSLVVRVEAGRRPLRDGGWTLVARDTWSRTGEVVVENVLGAGFDLHLRMGELPVFTYRWRPPAAARAAARVLRSRFHLLVRAALLQYPAIWVGGLRGRVPLHVSCFQAGAAVPLLAGPGGVGKSSLLALELAAGAEVVCDNLGVSDGVTCWGVVEPLRIEGGTGRRMPHGRREAEWSGATSLQPDRVLVVSRGGGDRPALDPVAPQAAVRALVAGTYMAGELRRYWGFAAALSLACGADPATPPVADVAWRLVRRLPAAELRLASRPGHRLADLLINVEETA